MIIHRDAPLYDSLVWEDGTDRPTNTDGVTCMVSDEDVAALVDLAPCKDIVPSA